MNEREQAKATALRWLEKPPDMMGDPDCAECQIARSYLRALEKIERLLHLADHYVPQRALDVEAADVWPSGKVE